MTIPFEQIKAQLLADLAVKREYDALAPEFEAFGGSIRAKLATKSHRQASRRILKTHPHLAPER
jgi:hypothetical protein